MAQSKIKVVPGKGMSRAQKTQKLLSWKLYQAKGARSALKVMYSDRNMITPALMSDIIAVETALKHMIQTLEHDLKNIPKEKK